MDTIDQFFQSISLDDAGITKQISSISSGFHLIMAAVMGFLVLVTYFAQSNREERDKNLPYVLPVLSVLMAVIMRIDGFQVAVFFGIFGILSIVRFRSDLTDQKGITFLLFAVIEGVLMGVNAFALGFMAWIIASLVIVIVKKSLRTRTLYRVQVRFTGPVAEARSRMEGLFTQGKLGWHLVNSSHELEFSSKTTAWEKKNKLEYLLTPPRTADSMILAEAWDVHCMEWNYEFDIKRSGDSI